MGTSNNYILTFSVLGTTEQSLVTYQYTSSGNLNLSGTFLTTYSAIKNLNYTLTGPSAVNLDFNNFYFRFEVLENEFSETFQVKCVVENEIEIEINDIVSSTNKIILFKLDNLPVGRYKIYIVINNEESIILNGNQLNIIVNSSNSKEGLYPKITFKVDFNIEDIGNLVSDNKTISIPILNKTLKQNEEFSLFGNDATYFKNNILPQYKEFIKII